MILMISTYWESGTYSLCRPFFMFAVLWKCYPSWLVDEVNVHRSWIAVSKGEKSRFLDWVILNQTCYPGSPKKPRSSTMFDDDESGSPGFPAERLPATWPKQRKRCTPHASTQVAFESRGIWRGVFWIWVKATVDVERWYPEIDKTIAKRCRKVFHRDGTSMIFST